MARRFRIVAGACHCNPKRPSPPQPIMRQERTIQATIFEVFAQHEIGSELKAMSQWLEGQRQLTSLVAGDLRRQGVRETGRHGLPADSVLRCALLKQQRQLSYEELAFHLEDSAERGRSRDRDRAAGVDPFRSFGPAYAYATSLAGHRSARLQSHTTPASALTRQTGKARASVSYSGRARLRPSIAEKRRSACHDRTAVWSACPHSGACRD